MVALTSNFWKEKPATWIFKNRKLSYCAIGHGSHAGGIQEPKGHWFAAPADIVLQGQWGVGCLYSAHRQLAGPHSRSLAQSDSFLSHIQILVAFSAHSADDVPRCRLWAANPNIPSLVLPLDGSCGWVPSPQRADDKGTEAASLSSPAGSGVWGGHRVVGAIWRKCSGSVKQPLEAEN